MTAEQPWEPPSETTDSPEVISALYVENAYRLRLLLRGVLKSDDLASEALQVTFRKAIESIEAVPEESRRAWLFQVAYREAVNLKRRAAVDHRAKTRMQPRPRDGGHDRPEESLVRFEAVEAVRRALEQLPEPQREVVRRRIYDDQTFAQIAADLGVPLGTVLTRMRAALAKLRTALREE